jgi:hypothetical protein
MNDQSSNQNGVFPSQWIEHSIRDGIIDTDVDLLSHNASL